MNFSTDDNVDPNESKTDEKLLKSKLVELSNDSFVMIFHPCTGELGIATSGDYHHGSLLTAGHTAEDTHLLQMNAVDRCPSQLSAVYADGAS